MEREKRRNPYLDQLFRPPSPERSAKWRIDQLPEEGREAVRQKELALAAFCHETNLELSTVDLSGFSPEPYRSQWKAWGWGREMMELVGGGDDALQFLRADYSIPEEEAIRGHIRSYWRYVERRADLGQDVRQALEERRLAVDRLAEVIKILNSFTGEPDDLETWQLSSYAALLEPHLQADTVSSHITSLQDVFVPVLSRIYDKKMVLLDELRGQLRPTDDLANQEARRHLVKRLLTVRKGVGARKCPQDNLWLVDLLEAKEVPCLFGPRLAVMHGESLLQTILVLRRDKRILFDSFCSFDDVALLLLALGIDSGHETGSSKPSSRTRYQQLRQTVEEDWGAISALLPTDAPIPYQSRRPGIFLED
jgi:hypothetical protein